MFTVYNFIQRTFSSLPNVLILARFLYLERAIVFAASRESADWLVGRKPAVGMHRLYPTEWNKHLFLAIFVSVIRLQLTAWLLSISLSS